MPPSCHHQRDHQPEGRSDGPVPSFLVAEAHPGNAVHVLEVPVRG